MKASVLISATDNQHATKGPSFKLKLVLHSLLHQDTDDFEVIVGNDGGTDIVRGICESYCRKFKERLTYYDGKGLGGSPDEFRKAAMYTELAKIAQTDVFITLDHDSLAEKSFVRTHIEAHEPDADIPFLVSSNKVHNVRVVGPPPFSYPLTTEKLFKYGKSKGFLCKQGNIAPDVFGVSQFQISEQCVPYVSRFTIEEEPEKLFAWATADFKLATFDEAQFSMNTGEIGNFSITRKKFDEMGGTFCQGGYAGRAGAGQTYMNKHPVYFAPLAKAIVFHLNHYSESIEACVYSESWHMDKEEWLRDRWFWRHNDKWGRDEYKRLPEYDLSKQC